MMTRISSRFNEEDDLLGLALDEDEEGDYEFGRRRKHGSVCEVDGVIEEDFEDD
ncbi:MAG: hypothetical protein DDT19_00902 [Syntrophomonadaceae bacterium]|nr:hypothetical protein [Bacillota bacterium]